MTSACLINGYQHEESLLFGSREYSIKFIGSGDPEQCGKEMDRLFRLDYTCFTFPCSFAGIYQPPIDKNKLFYATSVSPDTTKWARTVKNNTG